MVFKPSASRPSAVVATGFFLALLLLAPAPAAAISCTMQGEMSPELRSGLEQSASALARQIVAGNIDQVRALTIPNVAAQFQPIANSIQRLAPLLSGSTITIDAMYGLDASDLKEAQEQTQFFCDNPSSGLHEEVGIPKLPPGDYGLVLVHATGVKQPQQMALLLQRTAGGQWQLAGFFVKPLEDAGHTSLWYWQQARVFAQKGQTWNAHFYYRIATNLALPVDFLDTPNLQKLYEEQNAVKAEGLPGAQPLVLKAKGETYTITGMRTDSSLGGLDLVIQYSVADASDPVATRTHILGLMSAILAQYPQLRDGFHGLWVFANAPGQHPFAVEQAMNEIH